VDVCQQSDERLLHQILGFIAPPAASTQHATELLEMGLEDVHETNMTRTGSRTQAAPYRRRTDTLTLDVETQEEGKTHPSGDPDGFSRRSSMRLENTGGRYRLYEQVRSGNGGTRFGSRGTALNRRLRQPRTAAPN